MDQVIVSINGEGITEKMLEASMARYLIQLEEDEDSDFEPTKDNLKFIKTEVLNYLIERLLLLQRALKNGIAVQNDEVARNIEKMKANFSTAEEWRNNLVSLHVAEENLFNEVKKDMIIEKFLDENYLKVIQFTESELIEYYHKNEKLMKEPDLFSFYEAYTGNIDMVKQACLVIQSNKDISVISKELEEIGVDFHNHSEVPSYNLPEEVYNVLSDVGIGNIATMPAPDNGILIYKLNNKIVGRKFIYEHIKEKLAEYLIKSAKKEITDNLIKEEMDKADIKYENTDCLER